MCSSQGRCIELTGSIDPIGVDVYRSGQVCGRTLLVSVLFNLWFETLSSG